MYSINTILGMVVLLPFVAVLVWFIGWLQDVFGKVAGQYIYLALVVLFILSIIGFFVRKVMRLIRLEKEMLKRAEEENQGR